jgi:hypothetical protein
MATNNRTLETYPLLTINPTEIDNYPMQTKSKKSFWQRMFSWNTFFKGLGITLLIGGAVAVGYGIVTALWPVAIPLAIGVGIAATTVWLISSYKPIYNTMAKWGSALDGHDEKLDSAETLLKDIHKKTKRVNQELTMLNEQEQKNTKFLELTQKLAKQDESAAAQLAKLYLQSAKQQNHKYCDFNKIVKQVDHFDPKLANKLHRIYSSDNSLIKHDTFVKAQQCYQLLAHKNKHLAKQMAELYIDHQQQENEINHQFQHLRAQIHKEQPKIADKLTKFAQKPSLETGEHIRADKSYFKAYPCSTKRTWAHSLLKEIKAKQTSVAKLLKHTEIHDSFNQERQDKLVAELSTSIKMVNESSSQISSLTNYYRGFKTQLESFVHPIKQSFSHLGKSIRSHSPFKNRAKIKQPHIGQTMQKEAINLAPDDNSLNAAEQLTMIGLFSNPNEANGEAFEKDSTHGKPQVKVAAPV